MMSSGSLGDVVFIDHVNLRARVFTGSSEFDPLIGVLGLLAWPSMGRLLKRFEILCKKLPLAASLPAAPDELLLRVLVCPEWKVDLEGTFLGNADGCGLEEVLAGVKLMRFVRVLSVETLVFSDDDVFS
jgi:hypothetical protein